MALPYHLDVISTQVPGMPLDISTAALVPLLIAAFVDAGRHAWCARRCAAAANGDRRPTP